MPPESSLLALPNELLLPILTCALQPLPTNLPTAHALLIAHPRLYSLVQSILRDVLHSYDSLRPNGLLPHPYSNKDEHGNVVYPSFKERKKEFERIFEWRWALRILPNVVARMEGTLGSIEKVRQEREMERAVVKSQEVVQAGSVDGPLHDGTSRRSEESDEKEKPKIDIMDIREGLRRLHLQRQLEESMSKE